MLALLLLAFGAAVAPLPLAAQSLSPPSTVKTFGASTIPLNGTTSLQIIIVNPNAATALTGVAFTDTLPAGLTIASTPNLANFCGGTATATAGATSLSLSGGTVVANSNCNILVNVTGTTAGVKNNSVTVSSTNAGTGNTATASITVVAPPTINKAFGASSIALGATTSLSFTIHNPNASVALTGVAFSDPLPDGSSIVFQGGIAVATPNGLTGSCGGGAITATTGSRSVSLSGATLAAGASCTFSVNVVGTNAGLAVNDTNNVSSTNGGTGGAANATLNVVAPPDFSKAFGAPTIPVAGTTSLSFAVINRNGHSNLSGIGFTDALPAGLVVATPNGLTTSQNCTGATITAVAGSSSVSLSGLSLSIDLAAECDITLNVVGTTAGVKNNITSAVTSVEGGSGSAATATLNVANPPTITKVFGASSIVLGATTSLTFTVTNPNATAALTGVAFTDPLPNGNGSPPGGIVVATPNGLTGSCGGGTITATVGSGSVSLGGATLAAGATCTFSVNITGTNAGLAINTTGNVSSTNAGTGGTAIASVNVIAPPTLSKAFGAPTIPINGTTTLTFHAFNPNPNQTLTGIGFTDTLPAGLVVATPNGLTSLNCTGGTITAVPGSGSISLSGVSLPATQPCNITVNVVGATSGVKNNVTSLITSNEGGNGGPATASIDVVAPPTIAKAFGAPAILLNFGTSLTFTIVNPNPTDALTGVGFTDPLPAGLVVASPNGLTGSCGGGTITAVAGSSSVSLSGATLPASSSCTFSVTILGTAAGTMDNITGAVISNEGGTGGTASASVTVDVPVAVPSLNRWTLLLLVLALAAIGARLGYRRTRVR